MFSEEKIALDCPYCGAAIYQTLSWFKKEYSTCPTCQKGLAAGQFATMIDEIEQALDGRIEEMVKGTAQGGCCGKGSSSCCS